MINKIKALENLEARVVETATQLKALGYEPFPVLIVIDRLDPGIVGLAHIDSDQITISSDYYEQHEEFVLETSVPHELVHLYVNKYFTGATAHGPEFKKLMAEIGCDTKYGHELGYAKYKDIVEKQ